MLDLLTYRASIFFAPLKIPVSRFELTLMGIRGCESGMKESRGGGSQSGKRVVELEGITDSWSKAAIRDGSG
jgi:hypothetical protein